MRLQYRSCLWKYKYLCTGIVPTGILDRSIISIQASETGQENINMNDTDGIMHSKAQTSLKCTSCATSHFTH
jgi:hypothetical protein